MDTDYAQLESTNTWWLIRVSEACRDNGCITAPCVCLRTLSLCPDGCWKSSPAPNVTKLLSVPCCHQSAVGTPIQTTKLCSGAAPFPEGKPFSLNYFIAPSTPDFLFLTALWMDNGVAVEQQELLPLMPFWVWLGELFFRWNKAGALFQNDLIKTSINF